jgi:lambda repressor-like predicted transcriptional regulator
MNFILDIKKIFLYYLDMNSKEIIGHIMIATGETVTALAKRHGRCKQSFYDAIAGREKQKKIREIISTTINRPVSEIWPEKENK